MITHFASEPRLQSLHFNVLFVHQISLSLLNLFVYQFIEILAFFAFQLVGSYLDRVGIRVFLLLSQLLLHCSQVQKFRTLLESLWQFQHKITPSGFKFLQVGGLESLNLKAVVLSHAFDNTVPVIVEFL